MEKNGTNAEKIENKAEEPRKAEMSGRSQSYYSKAEKGQKCRKEKK